MYTEYNLKHVCQTCTIAIRHWMSVFQNDEGGFLKIQVNIKCILKYYFMFKIQREFLFNEIILVKSCDSTCPSTIHPDQMSKEKVFI